MDMNISYFTRVLEGNLQQNTYFVKCMIIWKVPLLRLTRIFARKSNVNEYNDEKYQE